MRRFGFSDESEHDAQAHADMRAKAALTQILAGATLPRRERKQTYAGAEGLPIREEIVERHEDVVVTRNGYGARCLNVSDVLFVDVDFDPQETTTSPAPIVGALCAIGTFALAAWTWSFWAALPLALLAAWSGARLTTFAREARQTTSGGKEALAMSRARAFSRAHPDLHLRVYRTPAGLRVLVMNKTFDPNDGATTSCFEALGADSVYVRMCQAQRCFRARISPKPWRIGLPTLSRITRAVWPVPMDRMAAREAWIVRYEAAAQRYAACRFLEALGSPDVDERAERVRRLHDDACRAMEERPLA